MSFAMLIIPSSTILKTITLGVEAITILSKIIYIKEYYNSWYKPENNFLENTENNNQKSLTIPSIDEMEDFVIICPDKDNHLRIDTSNKILETNLQEIPIKQKRKKTDRLSKSEIIIPLRDTKDAKDTKDTNDNVKKVDKHEVEPKKFDLATYGKFP
jgi:hypothetical protein